MPNYKIFCQVSEAHHKVGGWGNGGEGGLVRYIFSYCRVWRKVPEKVCVLTNTYVNRMARFKSVPSNPILAGFRGWCGKEMLEVWVGG